MIILNSKFWRAVRICLKNKIPLKLQDIKSVMDTIH